jgi:hypothetical protein
MGTLFAQDPRNSHAVGQKDLDSFLTGAVTLAKKHKIPLTRVIEAKDALERERANDLSYANGDIFDEQMAGFGELLRELTSAVEGLKNDEI